MERAPLCAAFHTSQPLSCQVWLSGPGCRPSCASLACDTWRWVFFCLSFLKTKDQGNFRTITGHKSKQWDAGLWRSSQKHGAVTRLRSPGDRSDCKNASVIKIFFSHPSVLSVNHGEKQKKINLSQNINTTKGKLKGVYNCPSCQHCCLDRYIVLHDDMLYVPNSVY